MSKLKIVSAVFATLLAFTVPLHAVDADAKSSSSSRSSSSSSYSKPSSSSSTYSKPSTSAATSNSGYSKPSTPSVHYTRPPEPKPVATKPAEQPKVTNEPAKSFGYSKPAETKPATASNNGYSKPGTTQAVTTSKPATPQSALNTAAAKTMSNNSLEKYKAERENIKNPPQPVNVNTAKKDPGFTAATKEYKTVDDYMNQRSRDIVIYRNRYPDAYSYSNTMSPNYGHYDSSFLMGLVLGHLGSNSNSNANWMYAQQNEQWYRDWRRDMEKKAEENAELKAKLAAMDADMAKIKEKKTEVKAPALPEGVNPSIAIAPEAMISVKEYDDENPSRWLLWTFLTILGFAVIVVVYFYNVGKKK